MQIKDGIIIIIIIIRFGVKAIRLVKRCVSRLSKTMPD